MGTEPKVTGLSPMTGPPGTKITVRGENLGISNDDILKITINGADCLPYLEWKSTKKIITRCTKQSVGSGDVVITTSSGGVGVCDVQFNCYQESVGPTDESAVWVDEIDYQVPEKEKLTILGSNEEFSVDLSSSRFKPQFYLFQRCSNANLSDLEQLRQTLQSDLASKSDPELISTSSNRATLLKSNLTVIMECLQILERLSKNITTSRDSSIESTVKSIKLSLLKTHELFDPLLAQKDLVQSIESAMQVFRQNETLFNLPSAIENSIKNKNYDIVVKEISGVITRLKTINIDQSLTERIQNDVTTKVDKLKSTIEQQLHLSCKSTNGERNLNDVKKLISHLNKLGNKGEYDLWGPLKEMSDSLIDTLSEQFDHFLKLSVEEDELTSEKKDIVNSKNDTPYVVQFVKTAMKIFHNTYHDILAFGQAYFDPKDEFTCLQPIDVKNARQMEFEEIILTKPITHLCLLLRLALVPDSSKLDSQSSWPSYHTKGYVNWLKHVLHSVITCHVHLTKVILPPTVRPALEDFKEFVFELRVRSMQILFGDATQTTKKLHLREDWVIEVDDVYGGLTGLPLIFEKNVLDTLKFANETIFKTNLPDEKSILKGVDVQASMKELAHNLINSFLDSLDNALIDGVEHPAESTRLLLASRESSRNNSKYINRLLVTICNCQFTKDRVFLRLQDEFEKLQGLKMDRVFKVCSKKYCDYIVKISEKFCRIKCTELNKTIKESKIENVANLQINLMIVNSQIFFIAPQLVNYLMTSIVNLMQVNEDQVMSHRL